jgi:hypothetical protein
VNRRCQSRTSRKSTKNNCVVLILPALPEPGRGVMDGEILDTPGKGVHRTPYATLRRDNLEVVVEFVQGPS